MRITRKNSFYHILVLCLAVLVIFIACKPKNRKIRRRTAMADTAITQFFLDFEEGLGGKWTDFRSFGDTLDYYLAETIDYNLSEKYLHFRVRDGEDQGGLYFDFAENGIDPIPLTNLTRVAWSWIVSRNDGTNGLWMIFRYLDTVTGRVQLVRCASWNEDTFDILRVYFDPKMTWIYHQENVVNFIGQRMGYDPVTFERLPDFDYERIVLTGIALGASGAARLEGGVDNIWVGCGRGFPPEGINTIDVKQQVVEVQRSELKAFSYGYIDNDLLPDRVDVYGDRIEIVDGRETCYLDSKRKVTDLKGVVEREKVVFRKEYFPRQRLPSSVSIADLNCKGQDDILIHFEDIKGNVFFANDLMRGELKYGTRSMGKLRNTQNKIFGAAVADMDGDGDLDLTFLSPLPRMGRVNGVSSIRNGGHYFRRWVPPTGISRFSAFGGGFADLDGDGDQDFFAAFRTYNTGGIRPFESRLYLNDGTGHFESDRARFLLPDDLHIEGAVLADLDNDADIDIYVVVNEKGFTAETILAPNMLYRNDGNGFFTDVSPPPGSWSAHRSEAAVAEDFDHDGDIDIVDITRTGGCVFYRNEGDLRFVESRHADLTRPGSFVRGLAVDFDHDGDMDVALHDKKVDRGPVLVSNGCATGGFVEVSLRGIRGNRAGIGGKVYLYKSGHIGAAEHLVGFREIHVERGFGYHGPPVAHFGIDTLETVDVVAVFPAVKGEIPQQVARYDVEKNSFLLIPETNNAVLRLWYSYNAEQLKYHFSSILFKLPAWIAALSLFAAVSLTGLNIRARFHGRSRWRLPHRLIGGRSLVLIAILTFILILIALYRSWIWSVPTILLSTLIISTDHDVGGVVGRFFRVKHDPEMEETLLIQTISRILHAEKRFRFLIDFINVDQATLEKYKYMLSSGLADLDSCVWGARKVIPGERCWMEAARELAGLKEIFAGFISVGVEGDEGELRKLRSEYLTTIDKFNEALGECRDKLRARYALDFRDEWDGLLTSFEDELNEAGIEVSSDLTGAENIKIYLTSDEFHDIFSNLMINSIWALSGKKERLIRVEASGERMHLKVKWFDSGCGIDARLKDDLFVVDVSSRRPGGKGMGCHNAGQIINGRQGFVWVEDPPEQWSTLIVMKFARTR